MDGKSNLRTIDAIDSELKRSNRIVQYTTEQEVRDYLRWRQVDSELRPSSFG